MWRKTLAYILPIIATVWAVLKWTADWIGRTTIFEDASAAASWFGKMLMYLSEQPALIFYGIPAVLIGISLLMLVYPTQQLAGSNAPKTRSSPNLNSGIKALEVSSRMKRGSGTRLMGSEEWVKYNRSRILPVLIDFKKIGIQTPDIDSVDNYIWLSDYFDVVGRLLTNDHIMEAKNEAKRIVDEREV